MRRREEKQIGVPLHYHYFKAVEPFKVPSMSKINLFENYLYKIGILNSK